MSMGPSTILFKNSGDKKLFHFSANSCYTMLVPTKPSKMGLWMYELVDELKNGLPVTIHASILAMFLRSPPEVVFGCMN